jgi:hypothetical protein
MTEKPVKSYTIDGKPMTPDDLRRLMFDHDRKAEFRERHCLFRRGAFLAAREVSGFRSCAPITRLRQDGFQADMRIPQTPPARSAFLRPETKLS